MTKWINFYIYIMLCAFNVYNYFNSALQKSFLSQRKEQKLNFKLKNQKKCV